VVLADLEAAERRVAATGENNNPPSLDGGSAHDRGSVAEERSEAV
jgi:hypothetical protein